MATATEIATRALRRIKVIDALQSPSAADSAAAVEALTAMIASWEAEGLSGDVLPLDARFEQGVVAMLGVRLAEEYGKEPGPVLTRDAEQGWSVLRAAYWAVPKSSFDIALTQTGHRSTYYNGAAYDGSTSNIPDGITAWTSYTAYTGRIFVTNVLNRYELLTEGTSGATGPTGTNASIADGTCVWCWRGVSSS